MKIFELILILFISINSLGTNVQDIDCDKLLDTEIKLKEKNISESDIKSLKDCGHNFEEYERTHISLAIGDIVSKGEKLTYRSLFLRLEEMNIKLKSQMKDQMVLLIFKFCAIILIVSTIIYWFFKIYKHKKNQSKLTKKQ